MARLPLVMQFFKYDHLPGPLQVVSKPFGDLAQRVLELAPDNDQRELALQKILEAKDAAVRARLMVETIDEIEVPAARPTAPG